MPQANDAELTELYSAASGLDVEDNEPNTGAPGQAPVATFDVHIEAVAGNALGSAAANYALTLTCIDDTTAAPNSAMTPAPENQQFNAANGWTQGGAAGNFFKEQVFPIAVPGNVAGHVFHYEGRLVGVNGDVVSFIKSNPFILV